MPVSSAPSPFQQQVADVMFEIQGVICDGLDTIEIEHESVARFATDRWTREGGGGGLSRVIERGAILEKGGVNVSVVHGMLDERFAAELPGSGHVFFAAGVSLVLHPQNPYVPTVHANFRYLEHGEKRWFGGGADLTPYYYDQQDRDHFHRVWRELCEKHAQVADYPRFRDWCDHYFYVRHRQEHRGVGGIFFDYLFVDDDRPGHAEQLLSFVRDGGRHFLAAYEPILRRNVNRTWGARERHWQELRRGRYVEFNLVYDRGTVFGLRTGGRVESILMSLPPCVRWEYLAEPEPGSPEALLVEQLRRPLPPGPFGP